jgi:predicted nucleotidyltransferase component of viral defense system
MSVKIIQERLDSRKPGSVQEENMALREITQEVALHALYNTDFYKSAALHGGTCLRIFHALNRFSEDLDFALLKPDPAFDLGRYKDHIRNEFEAFGYHVDIIDKTRLPGAMRSLFIKQDSLGKMLNLRYSGRSGRPKSIKIKLEVDTHPPAGAEFENRYGDFPLNYAVTVYTLSSLMAGKIHALLTRPYTKGRDWYDFLWHIGRGTKINFRLLENAIHQTGPWADRNIHVDESWLADQMREKIEKTDWEYARNDIRRFLPPYELKSLELWNRDFFLRRLDKLFA